MPEPDELAKAHSGSLFDLLKQRANAAPLSFRDYMHAVLYEPGYGYYVAGTEKFGRHGDFITAPEITPLFGQTLSRQIKPILQSCSGDLLEFGAGAGGLAASVIPELSEAIHRYFILEPSAELRQRQAERLRRELTPDHFALVSWLTSLPEHFRGVILANEVLDAFPVECFRVGRADTQGATTIEQLFVRLADDRIEEYWQDASAAIQYAASKIMSELNVLLPEGYRSEINLDLKPWFNAVSDCLEQGVMLVIDYGYPRKEYYSEERSAGTLACYYQHRAHHDPYRYPGLQDVTAHVDFTAAIEAADAAGFSLLGYTNQSSFLLSNGLVELADLAMEGVQTEVDRINLSKAVKTLTLPAEMGERFQVMALGKSVQSELQGFTMLDLSHRL